MTGPVEITVAGSFTAYQRPERAVVRATLALEADTAERVHARAAESQQAVTALVTPLHDPDRGHVTWWSSDQVRTWAQRPWNQDGVQLPLVHHARVAYQVKFRDFAELGRFLSAAGAVPGFVVDGIEWALTVARQDELVGRVRAEAVREAREKAQAYADAAGLGPVRLVAVADAGMLGDGLHPTGPAPAGIARMAAVGGGAELSFAPQDVAVAADVHARFAADPVS